MQKTKKLKIAMLGHKHIPSREGGVEIVVEELSTRMFKKGYDITVYNRSSKHALDKKQKNKKIKIYNGVKIKNVITIDKKGLAAMTSSFFATIKILFSKSNIVHYHAEGPCAMIPIIKFLSNKRIIVTIHGLDWQRAKWGNGFASKYIKFGEKMAVKYAHEIIVLSENVKKYFEETYKRKTNFIPNGVNKPEIKKARIIYEKYNVKKNDYILFLGRLVPEKGIHYLIDAFNNIKTNKKLIIGGAASDTDIYYQELIKKAKKNKNIIFTGFIQGEELEELYSNAYIYVLPSDLEGMPLTLLEAMSYNNCCLTSDIPECKTVMNEYGITFKKTNIKDLTEKMITLLNDKNLVKKYKDNSQKYVLEKYNWDDITKRTLELYENQDK